MLALAMGFRREPPTDNCNPVWFRGHSGGGTPGSIPNPEVKPSSADGTARETGWESRSLRTSQHYESRPLKGRLSRVGRWCACSCEQKH
jgi:hypothetical protein